MSPDNIPGVSVGQHLCEMCFYRSAVLMSLKKLPPPMKTSFLLFVAVCRQNNLKQFLVNSSSVFS